MNKFPCPSAENAFLSDHVRLILDSYQHFLGVPLITETGDYRESARQLFHASFALVSHNTNPDPVFNYANQAALNLFEFGWDEFSCLPSRLSAAQVNQIEREKLLAEVTEKGFISDYQGVRISKQGKRFKISNATVWNLIDCDGVFKGQAACFKDWAFL